jgi:hypothetical protein
MRRSRTDVDPGGVAMVRAAANALATITALALAACGAMPAGPAAPSCPTDRTIVLASQTDIARLARCTIARGVTIRSGASLDTSVLHALATITGDLEIGPTVGIEEITLGELRVVEGTLHVVSNGLLQGLYLPHLERAGRIEIDGNVAITTISLPRLMAVRGALRITDNASLELVDLSALDAVDQELVLTGDPQLALFEAERLQTAATVQLEVPKLPPDVTERLRAASRAP